MIVDSNSHLLYDDKNDKQHTNNMSLETSIESSNKSLSVNNNNISLQSMSSDAAIIPLEDLFDANKDHIVILKNNRKMLKRWIPLAILFIFIASAAILIPILLKTSSKQNSSDTPVKKVLFIILDGIPADVIENATIPNIRKIASIGQYKRAYVGGETGSYSETPTVSAPGYMDLITGTWLNKHNISDNDHLKPNYNYKNIFRLLKEQKSEKKIAIFSTWTENRVKLVGEGLSEAGNITFDYKFDGYDLDPINYPQDPLDLYIEDIDKRVVNETIKCIQNDAPDLSWLYLQYTDDVAHIYGDSPQFYQSITNVDQQIGQVYDVIEDRMKHLKEDWLVIITTDHGRDPVTGQDHENQTERERTTWLVTNHPQMNIYFQEFLPAIVDLLPTMATFMNIQIPIETQRELDGVPLIGNVSLVKPNISLVDDNLIIKWTTLDNTGNVAVWLTTTNFYKNGSIDNYKLLGTVPIENQTVTFNITDYSSNFYKIVLEGKHNMINKWIIRS